MKDWRTMARQWSNSVFCVKTVKKAAVWCMIGFGGEMHRGPFRSCPGYIDQRWSPNSGMIYEMGRKIYAKW